MRASVLALAVFGAAASHAAEASVPRIEATRCPRNPIVSPEQSDTIGDNVNGPSVIRVPDWLPSPLGRYYMYFAHHRGTHIRLAYSDDLCGAWKIHEPGTLRLEQAPDFAFHVASPDVHVDDAKREIRMYFHGRRGDGGPGQHTGVATSTDGIDFAVVGSRLGLPYFRVFDWNGSFLAVAMRGRGSGTIYRSAEPTRGFARGRRMIPSMRHAAILPWEDDFLVFFTRIGDAPERILVSRMSVGDDWRTPSLSEPVDVLLPEEAYEGADLPIAPSQPGPTGRARQLRDPAVFRDEGRTYLFYSVAGESGIAMAELELGQ